MIVLCIHNVVKSAVSCPWEITECQAERAIDRYRSQGYDLVSLDRVPDVPQNSLTITVDDARAGATSWLLRRGALLGVTAAVFPVPGWIDKPTLVPKREKYGGFATWRSIAGLRDVGHVIGSHSMTHVRLSELNAHQLAYELAASKSRIADVLGVEPVHFAAPYGRINNEVIAGAKQLGYRTVGSTIPGENDAANLQSGLLKRILLRSDLPNLGLNPE